MTSAPIELIVSADLRYRDLAIRAVVSASHLVGTQTAEARRALLNLNRSFDAELISAFSEIFNNIVIHGYKRDATGTISVAIWPLENELQIEIHEHGCSFDIATVPEPQLDKLPERGMGLHIAKSYLDQLEYKPGPPNVWKLKKFFRESDAGRTV